MADAFVVGFPITPGWYWQISRNDGGGATIVRVDNFSDGGSATITPELRCSAPLSTTDVYFGPMNFPQIPDPWPPVE